MTEDRTRLLKDLIERVREEEPTDVYRIVEMENGDYVLQVKYKSHMSVTTDWFEKFRHKNLERVKEERRKVDETYQLKYNKVKKVID